MAMFSHSHSNFIYLLPGRHRALEDGLGQALMQRGQVVAGRALLLSPVVGEAVQALGDALGAHTVPGAGHGLSREHVGALVLDAWLAQA